MKLFIGYSRDDKTWVHELWRALRDEANHDAWIDYHIVPAQDWWSTILDNVEACECCLYVMTPKSIASIYCRAEVAYALALNKPVLPLVLKPCDYPPELSTRRIQYQTITDDMSLDRVLFKVTQGLADVQIKQMQGKYPPVTAARPPVPTPEKKPEQVSEVFMLAEEAASESNHSLAEKLFQQVIDADPQGWGLAATERLGEIRLERERDRDYANIVQMAGNAALVKGARAAVKVFRQKYGAEYDPNGVLALLLADLHVAKIEIVRQPDPMPVVPKRPTSVDILPPPFDWIDIPAGKVTLEAGGYVRKGGRTFDVPAFSIGKYPITNTQFSKFIAADGYTHDPWWTKAGTVARQQKSWIEPAYWQDAKWYQPDYPVVGVSWFEAVAFCRWLSDTTGEQIMLPTEQQWQRAAQGDDGREFPWGNKFDPARCNTAESGINQTTPVDRYPSGHSPLGVFDMAGNVWEWCLTAYTTGFEDTQSNAATRVLRGGSWFDLQLNARAAYRGLNDPVSRHFSRGFRVVVVGVRPPSR